MRVKYAAASALVIGSVLACAPSSAVGAVQKLYWTEEGHTERASDGSRVEIPGKINRSNVDGSDVETVIAANENFVYLTASQSGHKLYYAIGSPTPQLWSADFDGGSRQLLATLDTANYVRGMAFEQDSKKLYWTSFHGYQAGNGKIRSANADGSNVHDVLSLSDGYPFGMAVDHASNLMFWANTEQNTLERAKLDGSERQVIGSGVVSLTTQLAVDPAANKLYWTDVDDLKIHWSNYDGSESAVISAPGSRFPSYDSGIAVDHASGSLFWSDTASDQIFRANLDGSDARVIVTGGLSNPGSMVIVANPEPSVGWVFCSLLTAGATLARRRGR
jgi:low density lipoprotein-related protein 2